MMNMILKMVQVENPGRREEQMIMRVLKEFCKTYHYSTRALPVLLWEAKLTKAPCFGNSKFYLFDVATVAVRRVRSLLHLAHVGNVVSFTIISYNFFANNEFCFPAELFSWLNLKPIILGKFQYFVEMESFYLWFMAPGSKYLYSMMVVWHCKCMGIVESLINPKTMIIVKLLSLLE